MREIPTNESPDAVSGEVPFESLRSCFRTSTARAGHSGKYFTSRPVYFHRAPGGIGGGRGFLSVTTIAKPAVQQEKSFCAARVKVPSGGAAAGDGLP